MRKLVEDFPGDSRSYQYLGEFFNRCQRYDKSIQIFKKGIRLNRENARLHWNLAQAYREQRKSSQAVRHLQIAMELGLEPSLQRYAATLLEKMK